jgi:predicted Zn-dependent protease with MMP-like domain
MLKITRPEFEKIVDAGIREIPEKFLQLLDNVVIVVEDEPTQKQKQKLQLRKGWSLFGLYEGIPQTARGDHYTSVIPDKITIFQKPIEQMARDAAEIKKIVTETVWHEVAHHFGSDEGRVQAAEKRRNT